MKGPSQLSIYLNSLCNGLDLQVFRYIASNFFQLMISNFFSNSKLCKNAPHLKKINLCPCPSAFPSQKHCFDSEPVCIFPQKMTDRVDVIIRICLNNRYLIIILLKLMFKWFGKLSVKIDWQSLESKFASIFVVSCFPYSILERGGWVAQGHVLKYENIPQPSSAALFVLRKYESFQRRQGTKAK